MGSAQGMIAEARTSLGMKGRPNAITRDYAKRHGDDFLRAPWCDMAVTYWARRSGNAKAVLPGGDRAYTVWHAQDFQKIGRWYKGTTADVDKARPGDIVFFDWGESTTIGAIDHVGVVEKALGGGRVQTIEGNTGDQCLRRVRSSAVIAGFGRPDYQEDDMPLSDEDLKKIRDIVWNTDTAPAPKGTPADNPTWRHVNIIRDTYSSLQQVKAAVEALAAQSPAGDRQALAQGVLNGLPPEAIVEAVAALPPETARQVLDGLRARLES